MLTRCMANANSSASSIPSWNNKILHWDTPILPWWKGINFILESSRYRKTHLIRSRCKKAEISRYNYLLCTSTVAGTPCTIHHPCWFTNPYIQSTDKWVTSVSVVRIAGLQCIWITFTLSTSESFQILPRMLFGSFDLTISCLAAKNKIK